MEKVAPVQPKPWREYVCGTGNHPSFSIFTAGGRILGKAMGEIFDAEPAKYIAAFFTKMNEGFVIPSKKIPDGQLTDSDIDLLEALRDFKLAQAAKLVQIEKEKPAAHPEKPKTPREELKAIVIEAGATEEHFIEVAIKARWVPPGTSAISEIDDATVTSMLADIDTVRIAIKKA